MVMKFWGFCGRNMPSLTSGSIWPYVERIILIEKGYMLQYPSKLISRFSLSITNSKRSMTSLRYSNLLVLMQILTTATMKKIRCELLICWLPIMSRKPIRKRTKTKSEISSQKPHYCIQQLTRSSCTIRYVSCSERSDQLKVRARASLRRSLHLSAYRLPRWGRGNDRRRRSARRIKIRPPGRSPGDN